MIVLGYFCISIAKIISLFISFYTFVLIISSILSFVGPDPYNPIVRFLKQITEPVFTKARRYLPSIAYSSGLDFTPLVILALLVFIDNFFVALLFRIGQQIANG